MTARAADIVRALKGRRCGSGWICRCPAHDDRNPSLNVAQQNGKVLVKCWAGCPQNAVIDALRDLGLWCGKAERPQASRSFVVAAGCETSTKPLDPMRTWRNAGPFVRGSPADVYLKTRGIELTEDEARSLRFSASLWHWPTQSRWPTMLARVTLASGAELGVHQTFLEPSGSRKASLEKARLFAAGGKAIGGRVWFGAADSGREFIVGEGIESTLSALRIFNVRAGCAALSAFGIRALILPAEARRVRIFADHDRLGQGVAAAREAARRWRVEGREVAASIAAAVGMDANDVWKTRTGT
jgi:putative DNA primase/helicase